MRPRRTRPVRAGLAALVVVSIAAACSARGEDDEAAEDSGPTATEEASTAAPTTAAPAPTTDGRGSAPGTTGPSTETTTAPTEPQFDAPLSEENFGTIESPCGDGDAEIAEDQNGGDTLKLATANDAENDFAPGLTKEMLDAAEAFAEWCNEQGGIQGLEIEIVNMDGGLFNAAPAMETVCDEAFAMVGGGLVFDDQTFPRFHECGMIDFAGYTVTPKKADSNGKVQPIPNPPDVKPEAWLNWGAEAYPDAVKRTALLFGDIDTTKIVNDMLKESMELAGWRVVTEIPVGIGEANWTPFAQQLKDRNIGAVSYTGQPGDLALFVKAMDEVGYRPELILQEANFYDQTFPENAGESGNGVFVRTAYAPFEEADQFPGMAAYLEMMETYNPDGKIAGLGLQSTSAHLMFATAANACLDRNDGVLERECVLAEGLKIRSWTGGGLHTETDPGGNRPPPCTIIMELVDGTWQRAFPELGSEDDNGGGWHCDEQGVVELQGDFNDESGVDPDRPN